MKQVYRRAERALWQKMQAIAGIHYNFSMPEAFWATARDLGTAREAQTFQTEGYLALIRFSRVWLVMYLLGASPAVCASCGAINIIRWSLW